MSTPILCVECARQKQPPRPAVWESRVGDICEPCRGVLKIPQDECDSLLSAKADAFTRKLVDEITQRSEQLPTQERQEKHQALLGAAATPEPLREKKFRSVISRVSRYPQTVTVDTCAVDVKAAEPTVAIAVSEAHLNRFWSRLSLGEKAEVFMRSL
jgi:hypothetical protein